MTTNNPQARGARPRSLYRTVLSLAIAAVIAASIPFAAIYVGAVQRPATLSALAPGSRPGATTRLITTASGRQIVVPATAGSATSAATPVVTRTSGAAGSGD